MDYCTDIDTALDNLKEIYEKLRGRYIEKHIQNPSSTEDEFSLDVKSFCILLHAALEDYIEGISIFSCTAALEKYVNEGVATLPLIFSLHHSGVLKSRVKEKDIINAIPKSHDDFIKDSAGEVRGYIVNNAISNNGINLKYLNEMLHLIGIHFDTSSPNFHDWVSLADFRGDYAHAVIFNHGKKPALNKVLSPESADQKGESCILFAEELCDSAKRSLQIPPRPQISAI